MSAIFGCVFLDGRAVPPTVGESMRHAMAGWGPDGVTLGHGTSAVLGLARLDVTPESVHEVLPCHDEESGLLITAAARLDNRDELCDDFGIAGPERELVADGTLVRLACRRWGEEAPGHLLGDWSFASWDERGRTLVLARDQIGNTGLYYHRGPGRFAFASDPRGLFALDGVERRLHELKLASYLTVAPLVREEETSWIGVLRLAPGTVLVVGPGCESARRYWDGSRAPCLEGMRDDDYVEGFLERFRAAVATRLRSRRPVGVMLSAGLDSGAVTALATKALASAGKALTAFTSVPVYTVAHLAPSALTDEWSLAHAVAARTGVEEHVAVDAATLSPLAGIERALAIHDAPQHAAANEYWILALLDSARERSLGVLLTGQLGNGGVSWSGGRDRIPHLFASGRWKEGLNALGEWRTWNGRSWPGAVARRLVLPYLRRYRELARNAFRPSAVPWADYAAIHPAFAARLGLADAVRTAGAELGSGSLIDPALERRLTLFRNGAMAGPIWHATGSAFGIEVRDPTADVRLLEFCLGVPPVQDVFHGGERMLIRRAMSGLLPDEVRWSNGRGRQAADVAIRLLTQREEMERTLLRLEVSAEASSYLDLPLMRRAWRDLQDEVTPRTSRRAATLLLRGIMCGRFVEEAVTKQNP